jgi:hypothetical protein
MNLVKPRSIILERDILRMEVINIISLIRLIEGGAAMFVAVNRNHHRVKVGASTIIPFVRYRLRV